MAFRRALPVLEEEDHHSGNQDLEVYSSPSSFLVASLRAELFNASEPMCGSRNVSLTVIVEWTGLIIGIC